LPAYEESTIYDQPIESLISKVHDKNLPIFKKRLEIVHAIKESRITIITGKTGTGKVNFIKNHHSNLKLLTNYIPLVYTSSTIHSR
jgi:phage antirepressor YoqD-like protein